MRALHVEGPLSRSELGTRTGLTRSAIRVLIGELTAAGLVEERSGPLLGQPGRPSTLVRLRADRAVVLALEIAVDYLAAAVVGLGWRGAALVAHRPIARADIGRRDDSGTGATGREPRRAGEPPARTSSSSASRSLSAASSGAATASWSWRPTWAGRTCRSASFSADALGTSHRVLVANEADLGALAEHRRGAGAAVDDLLYHLRRGGSRWRRHHRWPTDDRRLRLRRRDRPHAAQSQRQSVRLWLGGLLGDRGWRDGPAGACRPARRRRSRSRR